MMVEQHDSLSPVVDGRWLGCHSGQRGWACPGNPSNTSSIRGNWGCNSRFWPSMDQGRAAPAPLSHTPIGRYHATVRTIPA